NSNLRVRFASTGAPEQTKGIGHFFRSARVHERRSPQKSSSPPYRRCGKGERACRRAQCRPQGEEFQRGRPHPRRAQGNEHRARGPQGRHHDLEGVEMMMARVQSKLALRPFLPTDAPLLAEIFRASIEGLTADDYSASQQEAWASMADDEAAFAARLANALTLLGTIDGSPVGFASLAGPERIDMLYVHPAAAGQGIGSMLIDALEKLAGSRGAPRLTADVS